jgi:preprotein translocase subunit SecA
VYAEREDRARSAIDDWALAVFATVRGWARRPVGDELRRLQRRLAADDGACRVLDDAALVQALRAVARSAMTGLADSDLHRALILVAEAAARALGMRPYPTQLVGAASLLRGRLAEMQTGEGKTLTAGLAACVAGMAGVRTHVVTVNDYLAERDASHLAPLYRFFDLDVGVVVHGVELDAKRRAYACDIAYCTNKELVFDYLRDRVNAGGRATSAQLQARRLFAGTVAAPLLCGLHFAIVDEADSILIDEARTPLILAEKDGQVEHAEAFAQALALAEGLQPGVHFLLNAERREVSLTAAGSSAVADAVAGLPAPWHARSQREHLVTQALRAKQLFIRDKQYLVDAAGLVQIIDEYTGRVLPGRTWEQGLHQMIEAKEGVELSERTRTLARITYQRFFGRYLRLAGMTGTAREVAHELSVVYRLSTASIPTHRPSARRHLPTIVCPDEAGKWLVVAETVAAAQARGQPVLVGTRSVQASERLSDVLLQRGIVHAVLNARQDEAEAELVARAGRRGQVTVATNMAGRGTDIELGDGVAALGGLLVVLTEFHESPRIDRQLIGRCARQGDPGACVAIVAADDELFTRYASELRRAMVIGPQGLAARQALAARACRAWAQWGAERMHARTRRDTLRQDRKLDNLLSFAGEPV